jgi:uncharacterized protein YcbK (DUF882 family)
MRIHAVRLPFLPDEAAATGSTPLPGASASSSAQLTAADQAIFAGLLALAVKPKSTQADSASDDPASDKPSTEKPSSEQPAADDPAGITSTLNASMIVRDLGALQPQFRAKLERVISRMKDEYGHDVSVTETYRSQTRQDQLLQQGRTTPGPVVTWTNRSLHTQGRAADLKIDGKWDNAEGLEHLQQIASQEGLSTLGARDPGHVEMREDSLATISSLAQITDVGVSSGTAVARQAGASQAPSASILSTTPQVSAVARVASVAQVARVASVAPVARAGPVATVVPVAQVARVASVAQVAQVGQQGPAAQLLSTPPFAPVVQATPSTPPGSSKAPASKSAAIPSVAASSRTSTGKTDPVPANAADPRDSSSADTTPDQRDRQRDSDTPEPLKKVSELPKQALNAQQLNSAAPQQSVSTSPSSIVGTTATVGETGAAARAAAIFAMQDARDAQPVSHMTLQLDNGNGGLDRIRIGLHGATVGATIDMHDPTAATEVAANIHQLAAALQSRGLDPDSLRVRVSNTMGTAPAADLSRVLAAGGDVASPTLGTLFAQASSSSSRSRGDAQGQRPQQDPSRQRARKDQQGDPQ